MPPPHVTIELCGDLSVTVDGSPRESALPGRQGRLALAYMALERGHTITRERLIAALWGDDAAPRHGQALSVLLSKLRRALGPGVIDAAGERGVRLAPHVDVDLDQAEPALADGLAAREGGDAAAAAAAAARVVALADAGLLPGYEAAWLDEPRRRLEDLGLQARELQAEIGLAAGGPGLAAAERAAQQLVERAPFRESGHLLLMRVREAQGNVAEALRVYERLRVRLRDELGVPPGPRVRAAFERLLAAEGVDARAEPAAERAGTVPTPTGSFFATRSSAVFVGRRRELDRLLDHFHRAARGEPRLVLLQGEPGIGKTRLALQLMAACEAEGAVSLYGRCDAETLVPYQPFVEALRRHAARAPADQVRAWAARHGAQLGGVVPEIGPAAGAPGHPPGGPEGSERYLLFEAVAQVLGDIARRRPAVLVLDDLHWADKPTLLMLRQMVRSAEAAPLLIVASFRDTERPSELADMLVQLRREHFFESIVLGGLDEVDAHALMDGVGAGPLPERVSRTLWEETKGNPFFIEEMLRHLESRGAAAADPFADRLPAGIRDVIAQRLATLSERTRHALSTAAVVGREFSLDVLEVVGGHDEEELEEIVEEAVRAQVIAEVPRALGRCSFTHSLIRQTLYDDLTATRRARLHMRVGEALERLGGSDPPLAELAHHFSHAPPQHASAKALDYAERAARHAASVLDYEKAAELHGMALAALERAPGPPDPLRRGDLLLRLADARMKAADAPAARATFREAVAVARTQRDAPLLAQAALGFGAAGQMTGGVVDRDVVALLEEALEALGDGDGALRARLLARLAIELSFSGQRERRAALSDEALAIARRVADPSGLGFALVARHWSLWGPHNVEDRRATATELVRLAERSGDDRLAMQGHRWLMIDLLELADIEAVDVEIDAHAVVAAQSKRLLDAMYVHFYRAMRLLLAGRFEEAERLSGEALRLGERVQDANAGQAHLLQMFVLRRERGGLERLEPSVRDYAERFAAIPGWRCVLALLHAETGKPEPARRTLDEFAADGFGELPLDGLWLGAIAYLAETAAALGDPAHAAALHALLEPYADRNVAIGWAAACAGSASRQLGLLCVLLGDRTRARAHLEHAIAMNDRMRAQPWAARARVELAEVLAAEPGGASRVTALLDDAVRVGHGLGMPRLLAQAERVRAGIGRGALPARGLL